MKILKRMSLQRGFLHLLAFCAFTLASSTSWSLCTITPSNQICPLSLAVMGIVAASGPQRPQVSAAPYTYSLGVVSGTLTSSSPQLVVSGTNVGVGTWAPKASLEVVGNFTVSGTASIPVLNVSTANVASLTTSWASISNLSVSGVLSVDTLKVASSIVANVGLFDSLQTSNPIVGVNGIYQTQNAASNPLTVQDSQGNTVFSVAGSGGIFLSNTLTISSPTGVDALRANYDPLNRKGLIVNAAGQVGIGTAPRAGVGVDMGSAPGTFTLPTWSSTTDPDSGLPLGSLYYNTNNDSVMVRQSGGWAYWGRSTGTVMTYNAALSQNVISTVSGRNSFSVITGVNTSPKVVFDVSPTGGAYCRLEGTLGCLSSTNATCSGTIQVKRASDDVVIYTPLGAAYLGSTSTSLHILHEQLLPDVLLPQGSYYLTNTVTPSTAADSNDQMKVTVSCAL